MSLKTLWTHSHLSPSRTWLSRLFWISSALGCKPPPALSSIIVSAVVVFRSIGSVANHLLFGHLVLRNTDWGKLHKDDGDNYKDTIRSVITFSFTAGKDSMT